MNDPHVIALHYEISFSSDVEYHPPAARITYQCPGFDIEIAGISVRFLPKLHYSDRKSARAACDQLVRAWEVLINLEVGTLGAKLKYKNTEIIDRNPTPGVIEGHAEIFVSARLSATATVIRSFNRYPKAPDSDFRLTSNAESLWQRYRMFKEGREPLLSMAYFVFTAVNIFSGGKTTSLNVDKNVLRKLSELTSVRGDGLSARKLTERTTPLTAQEKMWIEKTIETLIVQVGKNDEGRRQHRITLNNLPPL